MKPCEMCDSLDGTRRKDSIYVCDDCNEKHPREED
tara:strand:+ start:443 stop:547 length:105 start_codon:yes stop_codon:yes gene_type:complete